MTYSQVIRTLHGISLLSVLAFLALLALQTLGIVRIAWWWILSPFWLPAALFIAALGILAVAVFLVGHFSRYERTEYRDYDEK